MPSVAPRAFTACCTGAGRDEPPGVRRLPRRRPRPSRPKPAACMRQHGGDVDIRQVSHSMLRVLVLMRRYVLDVTPGWDAEPPRGQRPLTGWARAGTETREALARAAAFLNEPDAPRPRQHAAGGELAWHLDAVSASLAAGRDLLQTHLAPDPGGERQLQSEWGLVGHLARGRPGGPGRDEVAGPAPRAAGRRARAGAGLAWHPRRAAETERGLPVALGRRTPPWPPRNGGNRYAEATSSSCAPSRPACPRRAASRPQPNRSPACAKE